MNPDTKTKISDNVKSSYYFIQLKEKNILKQKGYYKNPKLCLECKSVIPYDKRYNKFCNHICAGTYTNIDRHHSEETKLKISKATKGSIPWNKDLTIMIDKQCPICDCIFTTHPDKPKIFCSHECHNTDQRNGYQFSKKPNIGGYQKGSGRGKSGWYKGYWCDSSYELAWVLYHLDHKIPFERNHQGFTYMFENKEYKYYPDFIQNEEYIEIKGYLRPNDKFKFEQFPGKLKILYEKDIQEQFIYCKQMYGHQFIELYEGNPHNTKLNKCVICGKPSRNKCCSRSCAGLLAGKHNNLNHKMVSLLGIEPSLPE